MTRLVAEARERAEARLAAPRTRLAVLLAGLGASLAAACGGTPWFLGAPLDGHPSIPARSLVVTVAEHRRNAEAARAEGNRVVELAELEALEDRDTLRDRERTRLVELLLARASDWIALQRPIPLVADLRNILGLAPGRRLALARPLRRAERAAGDAWLAMGQPGRAEEEYRLAERDGMAGMNYRFRAVWGAAVGDLDLPALEGALAELPARVLASFSEAYLVAGGDKRELLDRAWLAARVHGPPDLARRLEERRAAQAAARATVESSSAPGSEVAARREGELAGAEGPEPAPSPTPPPQPHPGIAPGAPIARIARIASIAPPAPLLGGPPFQPPPGTPGVRGTGPIPLDPWRDLYGGPTLARRLLAAVPGHPGLLTAGARSRQLAVHLLSEDPTSPDSLELVARIEVLAGRVDSAASHLEDLVFYSGDKASAASRAARVWQETGQQRRACAAWEQSALAGAVDDPRWCQFLRCAAATPGASSLPVAERFVRARAPQLACAETLRPVSPPGAGAPPASAPPASSDPAGPPSAPVPAAPSSAPRS